MAYDNHVAVPSADEVFRDALSKPCPAAVQEILHPGCTLPAAALDPETVLVEHNLYALEPGVDRAVLEPRLRRLVGVLAGADDVRRTLVQDALIARLRRAKVARPAAIVDAAFRGSPVPRDGPDVGDTKKESQATAIVRLVTEGGAQLWHTPNGEGYITIIVAGHREHWPLASRGARDYLTRLYYLDAGRAPHGTSVLEVMATLSGIARYDGPTHPAYVRIAEHDDAIYLDLAGASWRVVEITRDGWRVVSDAPIRFRRPRGLLPLPVPEPGGSIGGLRRFLNVASDDDFVLIIASLLATFRARGPYPVLVLVGEQGAAKSTTARMFRELIDPSVSDLRAEPREVRDIMIAATSGHVVALDNVSRLQPWLSDAVCRLSTGGGFSTRQLYTDAEEVIFDAMRPTIITGINTMVTRGDLLDRAIVVTLPPVPDDRRRAEADLWTEFEAVRPHLLGALLDAVAAGLRRVGDVHLDHLPRMADFATWIAAAEAACPWPAGAFLEAYAGNRQSAIETTLDGDVVADTVRAMVPWKGTASELLVELNRQAPEDLKRRKDWFARPRQVADALRRLAPALRRVGIDISGGRQGHTGRRLIIIETVGASSSPSSPRSPNVSGPCAAGDEGDEPGRRLFTAEEEEDDDARL
jgi:hypothetical protein